VGAMAQVFLFAAKWNLDKKTKQGQMAMQFFS